MDGYADSGNKWTRISRTLPGRTDNAVKNRYKLLMTKSGAASRPVAGGVKKKVKAGNKKVSDS
jgi:hypothetical protein